MVPVTFIAKTIAVGVIWINVGYVATHWNLNSKNQILTLLFAFKHRTPPALIPPEIYQIYYRSASYPCGPIPIDGDL